jgi:hypothetical protein
MARARNKQQLLEFGKKEFSNLMELAGSLTPKQRDEEYIFDNRSAKDIIAHLYAWQLLLFNWYEDGTKGKKPQVPAPGYAIKDIPALNEKLFQEHKNIKWDDLIKKFTTSHEKLLGMIKKYSDEELITKRKYSWTGSTNAASYFASALSSHYVWAIGLIKKKIKELTTKR